MVELAFAKLRIPWIIQVCELSKAWSTISKSSHFKEVCSKRHPKFFGLLVYDADCESFQIRIYDIKSKEWLCIGLAGFPWNLNNSSDYECDAYIDLLYACDGGLVWHSLPLTNSWKSPASITLWWLWKQDGRHGAACDAVWYRIMAYNEIGDYQYWWLRICYSSLLILKLVYRALWNLVLFINYKICRNCCLVIIPQ